MKKEVLRILLFCFYLIVFTSCSKKDSMLDSSEVLIKVRDDKINLTDIVSDSYMVKLETGNDFLIGGIERLKVYDDKIFLLDRFQARKILVFDMKGNFLCKIGRVGKAPGEYQLPMDFTIDRKNKEIIVLDNGKRLLYYDLNGKFIRSQKNIVTLGINAFQKTNYGYAMIQGGKENNLLLVDENFKHKKSFFPYLSRSIDRLIPNGLQCIGDDVCLYRRNCNNVIYQIIQENIVPYKTFVFEDDNIDYQSLKGGNEYRELREQYNIVEDFIATENNNFVLFRKGQEILFSFFQSNVEEGFAYRYANFENDISFDPYAYIVGSTGEYFIWENSAMHIGEVIEKKPEKSNVFFKDIDVDDNPILLFTKMKNI